MLAMDSLEGLDSCSKHSNTNRLLNDPGDLQDVKFSYNVQTDVLNNETQQLI